MRSYNLLNKRGRIIKIECSPSVHLGPGESVIISEAQREHSAILFFEKRGDVAVSEIVQKPRPPVTLKSPEPTRFKAVTKDTPNVKAIKPFKPESIAEEPEEEPKPKKKSSTKGKGRKRKK